MKKVLLCIFALLLFLDFKVIMPIAQEFLYGTPVSGERSVSAKAPDPTPTPTPFQPIWSTPVVVNQPTLSEPILEPSLPENPYDFEGIMFDGSDTIEIWFYPVSDKPFSVSFIPVIPVNGPDDYKPGIYKSGVWADDLGSITVNPHSGCFRYRGKSGWTELEGEFLRRHFEGGECDDVLTDLSESRMSTAIEELQNSAVVLKQNEVSVELRLTGAGIIKNEDLSLVRSLDPSGLSQLIGISLDDGSIVIITSGRDTSHDPWYSAERLIVVLEQGGGQ